MTIRDATAADVPRMREIARAAKGYWGYDAERVRAWSEELAFPHERAQWIAECDGVAVAYAALLPPEGGVCELDDLWVDPAFMGQRIGRELFAKAVDRARELGAAALRLKAEPNAVGFYERMGAHRAGTAIGSWGRELPVMRLDLA